MNAHDLAKRIQTTPSPLLIHVLPEDHFRARRIEGSRNACVYEVAFVDRVRKLAPDGLTPIVVYGEGAPSLDSDEAARRLREAGYTKVDDFRGGLTAWIDAGFHVASDAQLPAPLELQGRYRLNTATSVIRWIGSNRSNHHYGHVKFADGEWVAEHGMILNAQFNADMKSVVCEDLTDAGLNAMLIRHLCTADFFDVKRYPTASFAITRIDALPGVTDGLSTHRVTGKMTVRGIEREISFPAVFAITDKDNVTLQAQIEIDRTWWGSRYGSARFFASLGQHLVNDHIFLYVKLHASRT
jgi:polyisoprenoid-binding protein YceI/rhodanese-related sulfurtransferase